MSKKHQSQSSIFVELESFAQSHSKAPLPKVNQTAYYIAIHRARAMDQVLTSRQRIIQPVLYAGIQKLKRVKEIKEPSSKMLFSVFIHDTGSTGLNLNINNIQHFLKLHWQPLRQVFLNLLFKAQPNKIQVYRMSAKLQACLRTIG